MTKWLAYVDESGNDPKSKHFVLACIMGNPDDLTRLIDKISGFKEGLALGTDPNSWELHGREIWHGPDRKKNYAALWPRTKEKKIAILTTIVHIARKLNIIVFFTVVTKAKIQKQQGDESMFIKHGLTLLLERIEYFLRSQGESHVASIVFDHPRPDMHQIINETFVDSVNGRNDLSLTQIEHIDKIEYTDSKTSVPVQVADITTYVIGRHMKGDKDMEEAFGWIKEMVWAEGKWSGSKVF